MARYAGARHVHVSRRGLAEGLVDEALSPTGRRRTVVTVVDGFGAALALANASDLVATVPERHTAHLRPGMHCFELPPPQLSPLLNREVCGVGGGRGRKVP